MEDSQRGREKTIKAKVLQKTGGAGQEAKIGKQNQAGTTERKKKKKKGKDLEGCSSWGVLVAGDPRGETIKVGGRSLRSASKNVSGGEGARTCPAQDYFLEIRVPRGLCSRYT